MGYKGSEHQASRGRLKGRMSLGSSLMGCTSRRWLISCRASASIDATFSTQNRTVAKGLKTCWTHCSICNKAQKRSEPGPDKLRLKARTELRWMHGKPPQKCTSVTSEWQFAQPCTIASVTSWTLFLVPGVQGFAMYLGLWVEGVAQRPTNATNDHSVEPVRCALADFKMPAV